MGRLLVLTAFVLIGVWLVRRALARLDDARTPPAAPPAQQLVHCAQCGLLLPQGEARTAAGRVYCSEEHVRLGPRRR